MELRDFRIGVGVFLFIYFWQLPADAADPLDTWRVRTSGTANSLYMVNYGSTQFVAVGVGGTIRTSPDGASWTGRTSPAPGDIYAVAYGGGLWAACGPDGLVMTSPNGVTWTSRNSGTNAYLYNIAYGNGRFMAVGWGTIITSTDGINWTSTAVTPVLNAVTFANDRFVMVGSHRDCLGGIFCYNYPDIFTSINGSPPWTQTFSSFERYSLIDVTYGANTFVSVGDAGALVTSPDGTNWTRRPSPVSTILNSCTFGAGNFVMVGEAGAILSSTNGTVWTPRTPPVAAYLFEVTYGNNTFVIVGGDGTILQSEPFSNFSIGAATVVEGDSGSHEATMTVALAPAPTATVNVSYATANGTARAGEDYVATNGVLTFQAGQRTQAVRVSIIGDAIAEADETFFVNLSNPTSGLLEVSQGIGTILDDEAPLRVVQSPQSWTVNTGSNVTLNVQILSRFPPVTYEWQLNGVPLGAATNDTLLITGAQFENDGVYRVIVRDNGGNMVEASAQLSVLVMPAFVQNPVALSVPVGGRATFSAQIMGNPPPFTYIWRVGSTPFLTNLSDQRINFLVLSNVQPSNAGAYRLVVKNSLNASTIGVGSSQVVLTVLPDTDADGLPDAWETSRGVTDPAADPDLDTMSNLSEYLAGTDPQNGQSYLRVDRITSSGNARLEFMATSNTTYTVQRRNALTGLWSWLGDVVSQPLNHTAVIVDPAPGTNAFYRLVTPRLAP